MDIKNAFAGTLESGDILIQIAPSETGTLQVDLESMCIVSAVKLSKCGGKNVAFEASSLSNSESKLKK